MTQLEPPPTEPVPFVAPVDEQIEALDPAQRSLSDALRVSFGILKLLIILLLIAYICSGIFRVREQQLAVLLVFGRIVGEAGAEVYGPGWHIGPPPPIGEMVPIPVAPQQLNITRAFWYEVRDFDRVTTVQDRVRRAGPLNPLRDGSLVTGDANIVHARSQVTYKVSSEGAVDYVENIGDMGLARQIVRNAVESGIVHAVAQIEADELISGRAGVSVARRRAQEVLDEMRTGIQITGFNTTGSEMPLSVLLAYKDVSNAENEKASLIDEARTQFAEILGQTAGEAYQDLHDLIQQYEAASSQQQSSEVERLAEQLNRSITELRMNPEHGGKAIGGDVAAVINQAHTRRTEMVQSVKSEAERFNRLLTQYRENPDLLLHRRFEHLRESIFTGDVEVIYTPTDANIWLEDATDPEIQQQRQEELFRKNQEQVRDQNRQ